MVIGLHDADAAHFRKKKTYPNYALMKISTYHKLRGDTVKWWLPVMCDYDLVYSSKIFTFTPTDPYLPETTIKGGTGYDIQSKLPDEIDALKPDYSLYPDYPYDIGFLTRGCPNRCEWCVVPEKEGSIQPYRRLDDIAENGRGIVLMDNNILASSWGIRQIENCKYPIDINQGMDARLVSIATAQMLSKLKWIKYLRFACDTYSSVKPLRHAIRLLNDCGVPSTRIFVYFLVRDIPDAMARIEELRDLGAITLYAQAYRDLHNGGHPISKEAQYFATKYVYSGQWRKSDWYDTYYGKLFIGEGVNNA